jgi:hypothetical protein
MTVSNAASIHARLLNRARERGEDFNLVLTRFAIERFLFRLSQLPERNAFLLKGALLFELWFDTPHRPTRDADLLGLGDWNAQSLERLIQAACSVEAADGIFFDPATTRIEEIRESSRYRGLRVRLVGTLGQARITVQLDIGFGDAVTPGPVDASLPSLLPELPPVELKAYPRATVIAEKLETIVSFGMANTRLKDYFDLYVLAAENVLKPTEVASAIAATFRRRGTELPTQTPLGLTREYATDVARRAQWEAFLNKNGLEAPALVDVVEKIYTYLDEPLRLARHF